MSARDDSSSDDGSGSVSGDSDWEVVPPPPTPTSGDRPVPRPSSTSSSRPSSASRAAATTSAGLFGSPAVIVNSTPRVLSTARTVSPGPADYRAAAAAAAEARRSGSVPRHLTPLGVVEREDENDEGGRSSGSRPASASRAFEHRLTAATAAAAAAAAASASPSPSSSRLRTYYTEHDLRNRPRSNPRTRTPMRDASPMPMPLNRSTVHDGDEDEGNEEDGVVATGGAGGRVTVLIGAGAATGTFRARLASTPERRRPSSRGRGLNQPRSSRQGPSKRKVRRWNNDRMIGVASELAAAGGTRGEKAAEAFLRGEAEAGRYAMPNKPLNYRSEFARMADDEGGKYADVRERFVRGEVAASQDKSPRKKTGGGESGGKHHGSDGKDASEELLLRRIQPRLRAVLVRSCSHPGSFASKVVHAFEEYLLASPHDGGEDGSFGREEEEGGNPVDDSPDDEDIVALGNVLLRPPSTRSSSGRRPRPTTDFYFPESGGFHRLLLHAVCQFHGLEARSSSSPLPPKEGASSSYKNDVVATARRIRVTGTVRGGSGAGGGVGGGAGAAPRLLESIFGERQQAKDGKEGGSEAPMLRRPAAMAVSEDPETAVTAVAGHLTALKVS